MKNLVYWGRLYLFWVVYSVVFTAYHIYQGLYWIAALQAVVGLVAVALYIRTRRAIRRCNALIVREWAEAVASQVAEAIKQVDSSDLKQRFNAVKTPEQEASKWN